jgi:hypothetical protein
MENHKPMDGETNEFSKLKPAAAVLFQLAMIFRHSTQDTASLFRADRCQSDGANPFLRPRGADHHLDYARRRGARGGTVPAPFPCDCENERGPQLRRPSVTSRTAHYPAREPSGSARLVRPPVN